MNRTGDQTSGRLEPEFVKNVALSATAEGITIADATLPDKPLVYANEGFSRLTGYSVDSVIGRNCRFLQGPETDKQTVARLRTAIAGGQQYTVQLLNYRKDGTPFWNRLSVTPVHDDAGDLTHYIGVQSDVTEQKNTEDALLQAKRELEEANQRMAMDLTSAALVQRRLLPQALPEDESVELAWTFRPCTELAGDILNAFWLDDHRLGLYVLDVSGHGVAAALLAVSVSRLLSPIGGPSCLYTAADSKSGERVVADPAEVAHRLNRYFPLDSETNQYFTLVYGILDTDSLSLRYVAAGHPPPVHVRNRNDVSILEVTGPPVGMLADASFETGVVKLQRGDRLYCLTDGVSDTENEGAAPFGQERVMQQLLKRSGEPLKESVDSLMGDVDRWSANRPLEDDASILALEVRQAV